ncbi:hypothetical protein EDB80DRAFT_713561 [Ilyonectria destructans]|nr:hypothetical protein EDB80DRAFT_713561 [Ilyonectria destructans]
MTDIFETATAVGSLIGQAITLIQHIQTARERVKGASMALNNVSSQLDTVSKSLTLVQSEPRLKNTAVDEQVQQVVAMAEELRLFFDELETRQLKGAAFQTFHALKEGDKADKRLSDIMSRLSFARDELSLRISLVNVGITGNMHDGFRVAINVVMQINEKVTKALGMQLIMVETLKNRQLAPTSSQVVELEDSDIEALGLRDRALEQAAENNNCGATTGSCLTWTDNEVGGNAGIAAGNIGYTAEENQAMAPVKATVTKNKFGEGLRFISGHVSLEGSSYFFKR